MYPACMKALGLISNTSFGLWFGDWSVWLVGWLVWIFACFWDKTHVAQTVLKLFSFLPPPPKCRNYRHIASVLASALGLLLFLEMWRRRWFCTVWWEPELHSQTWWSRNAGISPLEELGNLGTELALTDSARDEKMREKLRAKKQQIKGKKILIFIVEYKYI